MKGKLYGVGVGPGDPELLTLKALRVCRESDVIAIPHKDPARCLALQILLGADPALGEKPIVCVDMPMTKDKAALDAAHNAGADRIAAVLDDGRQVAFITLGDPTVYSTYFYIHEILVARGYDVTVIPGITSFCAAAASLGIPLCMNSQQLHVIPGTYEPETALDCPGTRVLMKNNIPQVRKALEDRGLSACMVENATMETERCFRSTAQLPETAGYYSLFIVKDKD